MAAEMSEEEAQRLSARGIVAINAVNAFAALDKLLASDYVQAGVMSTDWEQYCLHTSSPFFDKLMSETREQKNRQQKTGSRKTGFREILAPLNKTERLVILSEELVVIVADELRLDLADVGVRMPLFDMGIDSLTALELKNRLQKQLDIKLSATLLFDYPTIESLSEHLLETVAIAYVSKTKEGHQKEDNLAELSEEEAEAILLRQLEQLEQVEQLEQCDEVDNESVQGASV